MKKDTAHKRNTPSVKVESLHENMGLGKKGGYGDPHESQDYLFNNLKNSGSRSGGMKPKKNASYPRGTVKMPKAKAK